MASAIGISTFCCRTSVTMSAACRPAACGSYTVSFRMKSMDLCVGSRFCEMGRCRVVGPWSGFRQLGGGGGGLASGRCARTGRRGRGRRNFVCASLFGVGAPEALVIGVVALLVFGPKGLAEVARNLGKTLRAFQPTIRELQEVSREFKSSLEREIGLDEVPSSSQYGSSRANSASSPPVSSTDGSLPDINTNGSSPSRAYTSEEFLKITEEQIKAAAALQQSPLEDNSAEPNSSPQASVQETMAQSPAPQKPESPKAEQANFQ